jgi:hypothetical protein
VALTETALQVNDRVNDRRWSLDHHGSNSIGVVAACGVEPPTSRLCAASARDVVPAWREFRSQRVGVDDQALEAGGSSEALRGAATDRPQPASRGRTGRRAGRYGGPRGSPLGGGTRRPGARGGGRSRDVDGEPSGGRESRERPGEGRPGSGARPGGRAIGDAPSHRPRSRGRPVGSVRSERGRSDPPGGGRALSRLEPHVCPAKYDASPYTSSPGSIPFVYFAGKFLLIGGTYQPDVLQGKSWNQIAQALADPSSPRAQAILGSGNQITAAFCGATGQQPTSVCDAPAVQSLERRISGRTRS